MPYGYAVITAHPYSNLSYREQEFADRIRDAAERGGGTFYAGGANPDFVGHRLAMT